MGNSDDGAAIPWPAISWHGNKLSCLSSQHRRRRDRPDLVGDNGAAAAAALTAAATYYWLRCRVIIHSRQLTLISMRSLITRNENAPACCPLAIPGAKTREPMGPSSQTLMQEGHDSSCMKQTTGQRAIQGQQAGDSKLRTTEEAAESWCVRAVGVRVRSISEPGSIV